MKAQALGLVVGLLLLLLALRGVDARALLAGLAAMDLRWLLPVAGIFLVQQLLRAARQAVLVRTLAPEAGLRDNLAVLCMSFLFINTLPGRVGELIRPLLLRRRFGLPLGAGLALVFFERLIDLSAALLMLQYTLLRPVPGVDLGVDLAAPARALAWFVLLPGALFTLAAVIWGPPALGPLRAFVDRAPDRVGPTLHRVLDSAGHFLELLHGARAPGRLALVFGLTAVTWSGTAWLYVALGQGFGLEVLGWSEGVGVLAITMLGTALPAPPGFVGVYEASCRLALARLGVVGPEWDSVAMAYAVTLHGWVWGVQALTALWFFVRDGVSPRGAWAELQAERASRMP